MKLSKVKYLNQKVRAEFKLSESLAILNMQQAMTDLSHIAGDEVVRKAIINWFNINMGGSWHIYRE